MKILRFHQLTEKHIENPEFRIKSFLTELKSNINDWFENGSLSSSKLVSIDVSNNADLEKSLIFNFEDVEYYYQIYVLVSIEDVGEDSIGECFVKVKRYNQDGELIRSFSDNVDTKDLSEDKIIEMISKLDSESTSLEDGSDDSLSDDESDLGDTAMY